MRIFLTGGTGYVGSHVSVALIAAGHEAILLDNFSNSSRSVGTRIAKINKSPVEVVSGDIRDTDLLVSVLKRGHFDAVLHFAGLKSVNESLSDPVSYFANNVQGTVSLLEAMLQAGVSRLIFSSSATVYGEPQYLPLDESHPIGVTNPYGRTKVHIEELLADVARARPDWSLVCLRYFNPVGAHESGLIGEDPKGRPNNLMPYIARVAARQLPILQVFGGDYPTADGTCIRDYIHVSDVADGHVAALRYLTQRTGWDAINLGTGRGQSVLEMVKAFEAASGCCVPYEIVARRHGDVPVCFAAVEKARRLLEWEATRSVAEMCESAWNWQRLAAAGAGAIE